jgi:hypothetical protein
VKMWRYVPRRLLLAFLCFETDIVGLGMERARRPNAGEIERSLRLRVLRGGAVGAGSRPVTRN